MKKLLILFSIAWLPCYATAFGTRTQWDIQTTGSDTNGGAFDPGVGSPGTNESMGAGTAVTITLASSTTGTSSPAFTSTTHGPGNFIDITGGSGCTTGHFELLSQSSGTGTFNVSMGTTGNVCTGTLGGSLLTNATAFGLVVRSNTVWLQGSGTYTLTAVIQSPTSQFNWIGYGSTHGDNGTRPFVTTATNSTKIIIIGPNFGNDAGSVFIHNMDFSNTAGTRAEAIYNNTIASGGAINLTVSQCSFTGFVSGIAQQQTVTNTMVNGVSVVNSTSHGIAFRGNLFLFGSYIYNNTGSGLSSADSSVIVSVDRSIIANNGSAGVSLGGSAYLRLFENTIANNTGAGVSVSTLTGATPTFILQNNIIYGNSTYGVNAPTATDLIASVFISNNALGANSTANYHFLSPGAGDVTLTASPFTSGSDFSLNSTAGGGAVCKGAGILGLFPNSSTSGTLDIGAVQSACSSGSFACGFSFNIPPSISTQRN